MAVEIKRELNSKAKRDPEATRRRLMEAAIKLFAEKGRDGTSVDEICKTSGVNCRMIYHYFGSKDGLYMAMLKHVYGRLHEIAMNVDADSPLLADYLETLTERYFRFLQKNPEFVAVLRWENASGAKGIHQLDLNNFRNQHLGAASRGLDGQRGEGPHEEGPHEEGQYDFRKEPVHHSHLLFAMRILFFQSSFDESCLWRPTGQLRVF